MSPITPTGEDCDFAHVIYECFRKKPGAEHIASEVALRYLSACLRLYRPQTVLELGAGIGTITAALLRHSCGVRRVVATETDAFCLTELKSNLSADEQARLAVVRTKDELRDLHFTAAAIVGDGGFYSTEEMNTAMMGTLFFVEGERRKLRDIFQKQMAAKGWGINFQKYGNSRTLEMGRRKLLGISVKLPRFKKNKGCWIGRVIASDRT
jgi:precorrin-6B methylase 2